MSTEHIGVGAMFRYFTLIDNHNSRDCEQED